MADANDRGTEQEVEGIFSADVEAEEEDPAHRRRKALKM